MHQATVVADDEVVEFVRRRRLFGRGAGWIDMHILASALVDRVPLWTADLRISALAEELRLGHPLSR